MASTVGPRIVTSGLVLHLDAGDLTSYPGEPTINVCTAGQQAYTTIAVNNFSVIDSVSTVLGTAYSAGTEPPTGGGYFCHSIISATNSSTSGNRNHYYGFQFYPVNGSTIASKTFTFSAWVKGPIGKKVGIILTAYSGWFTNGGATADFTLTGEWQRIYATASFDAGATGTTFNCRLSSYGALPNNNNGTSADVGYVYFYSSIQVEEKAYVTQFCDGTRSASGGFKDLSGNGKHHSIQGSPTGTLGGVYPAYITTDGSTKGFLYSSAINTSTTQTVVIWMRSSDVQALWVMGNGNGGYFLAASIDNNYYSGSCGSPTYWIDLNSVANPYAAGYLNNTWRMFEAKNVNFSGWTQFGWFYQYGSGWQLAGDIGIIMIYNRNLSAAESAQNYAALRTRFGRT